MYEVPSMKRAEVDCFLNGAELEAAPGAGLAYRGVRAAWRGPHAQVEAASARPVRGLAQLCIGRVIGSRSDELPHARKQPEATARRPTSRRRRPLK